MVDRLARGRRLAAAWRVPLAIGVVILGVFLVVANTRREPIEAAYVGRDVCADCHAAQVASWSGSHHDLAMQTATDETVLGDFSGVDFTHGDVTSTFSARDGAYYVRTDGPDGAPTDYEIAYTFGVTPLQQYLIGFPGGRYQALSIAWDSRPVTEGGQRWFHLYGDADVTSDDPLHWTKQSQNWNSGCAACHSTNLDKGFDVLSRTYDTSWSENDVSCEACHGPGASHVALAEEASRDGTGLAGVGGLTVQLHDVARVWTVQPGSTTATRAGPRGSDAEVETCAYCHARRAEIREGRAAGDPLLDTHVPALLAAGLYHPDGQIDDEVYVYGSFVQSKMYAAGVTCSDCHDPHTLALRAEGNALCTQCHLPAAFDVPTHHFHDVGSDGAQCVSCHMPERDYMVVDPRRDHSLRVPRPDLTEAIGTPNACGSCHDERGASWAAAAVEAWFGPRGAERHYGQVIAAARIGDPAVGSEIVELARDTTTPTITRATALSLLTRYPPRTAVAAIGGGLRDPDPLVRLGALRGMAGLPQSSVTTLAFPLLTDSVRAVRIEAARSLARTPWAVMSVEQQGTLERVLDEYREAQMVNGDRASAWVNLAGLAFDRGDLEAANRDFVSAASVEPGYLPTFLNLADMLRATGREDEAERALRDALELDPESPEALHALGLLRVRQGEDDVALELLERAASGRPENARFGYVYGVALASGGRITEALEVLRDALDVHPFDADLLTALATYNRDLDNVAEAIGYAERLSRVRPDDSGVEELLRQLGDAGR